MVKPEDTRLVVGSDVHAKATVVFSNKGDARRYIGHDFANRYVNGVVHEIIYKQNKRGTLLSYPVIDFYHGGAKPKRVTMALSQVKEG